MRWLLPAIWLARGAKGRFACEDMASWVDVCERKESVCLDPLGCVAI